MSKLQQLKKQLETLNEELNIIVQDEKFCGQTRAKIAEISAAQLEIQRLERLERESIVGNIAPITCTPTGSLFDAASFSTSQDVVRKALALWMIEHAIRSGASAPDAELVRNSFMAANVIADELKKKEPKSD